MHLTPSSALSLHHWLITGVFLCAGNRWTLHPWKDPPPVGQNKVPGSLWAHIGPVPLPAQVNDLGNCVIHLSDFSQVFSSQFNPSSFFFSQAVRRIVLSPLPPSHSLPLFPFLYFKNLLFSDFSSLPPVRNKIDLESTQALFLLVAERSMSCMSSSMGEVYSRHSDTDGFLYITYASQEMFGAAPPAASPHCWAWERN